MNDNKLNHEASAKRRAFIKDSAAIIGGTVLGASMPFDVSALSLQDAELKIALVGCGSRGAGAAVNALNTAGRVKLVAMADVFRDQIDKTYDNLTKIDAIKSKISVPDKNKFVGFDAYEKAIALADVILLVTPAAFRPQHFEACVKAGKHVFMEKPLASDAPGIRKILETGKQASLKNLKVVVGLQNRYDGGYREMVQKINEGAIGRIVSATDYYLIGPTNLIPRKPGQTEMEYQMRNWRYFNWLWAGSPAGLQIHNTDIVNWVMGSYPVRAQGMGGRSSLKGINHGDVFDHFFIEYEYANGVKLNSQIRHIAGTFNKGGANFIGTKGTASWQGGIKDENGNRIWRNKSDDLDNAYQTEHDELFKAIRNNTALNDTEWGAMSTMTTIMGRMAAHSGKMVEWNEAINSNLTVMPERLAWDAPPQVLPDKDGNYPVPNPGQSPVL